jgi:hypothetical protein
MIVVIMLQLQHHTAQMTIIIAKGTILQPLAHTTLACVIKMCLMSLIVLVMSFGLMPSHISRKTICLVMTPVHRGKFPPRRSRCSYAKAGVAFLPIFPFAWKAAIQSSGAFVTVTLSSSSLYSACLSIAAPSAPVLYS